MAGENDFLAFATGTGANVESQTAWAADASVGTGFVSGLAQSVQANKAWRQSSVIANMIGQFIANADFNANDNAEPATLLANFISALGANIITASNFGNPGYIIIANTFIVCFGSATIPDGETGVVQGLGVTIPNAVLGFAMTDGGGGGYGYGIDFDGLGPPYNETRFNSPLYYINSSGAIIERVVTATGWYVILGY
jgi:hypothetical protein